MYRANPLKEKLQRGHATIGCWLQTPSVEAAEILAHAGFDFLLLDHEHGPATLTDAANQLRAIQGTETASLLRVPWNDLVYIKRALDIGVEGIMVPMVETAEQAKAAVAACLYPPAGIRGGASSMRASTYGYAKNYHATANNNVLIVLQIESHTAVENLEEIAAVAGVDALFIGPRDLSGSIGKPGQFNDPDFKHLLERAEERALASGKWVATITSQEVNAKSLLNKGYKMIVPTSEVALMKAGAAQILREIK